MTELTSHLKVLHIISGDRWAGAEVQAYTLLAHLHQKLDLHVVVMNPGELEQRLRNLGIAVTLLDETKYSAFQIFFKLINIGSSYKPDIVHTHRQKENILGGIANIISCRAVSVRTVHGAPEFKPSGFKRVLDWLDTLIGKYFQKAVISVSSDLSSKLAAKFNDKKIVTIVNGVDIDAIKANIKVPDFKSANPTLFHVGIVGRLDPVKRVDIFLKMAALLVGQEKNIHWMFHIFGEGGLLVELQNLAAELGIAGLVIFHNHRLDILDCIAALDVMVMCSDHEGLPMAALESMALGVPLLAHKVGGLVEVLSNYPEQLIEDHSPVGYSSGLIKLLNKQEAPNLLDERFRSATNANSVYSLYNRLRGL